MAYQDKLKPLGSTASYQNKLRAIPKPEAVQSDHGFLGNVAADIVKPFARAGTNLVNAGQILVDKPVTKPFSGSFLGDVKPVGNTGKGFVADVKDSVGVGAELASNIPIFKEAGIGYDVLKGVAKEGGMKVLKSAAVPLIKEGATAGFLSSGGRALQNDESLGQGLLDTAIGTGIGAIAAPVVGAGAAVLGKGAGKYTRLFDNSESKFAAKAAEKDLDNIAEYVRAPLTATEKAKLAAEKRGTEYGGLFNMGEKKFKLGDQDYLMAQATKDLVDPRMSQADANIDRILKNVKDVHDNQLMPFLKENPVPYHWSDLKTYMDNRMKPSELLKISPDSNRIFNTIKNKGLSIISQFPPTQEGVQQARTAIDNMINTEFGEAIWNKAHPLNSGIKEAVLKLRTTLNDFTHDSLRVQDIPNLNKAENFLNEAQARGIKIDSVSDAKEALLKYFGTDILPENELKAILFRQQLKNMNLKLKAADNIWKNSAKEVGKSRFQNFTKDPTVRTAAGIGLGYGISQIFRGANSAVDNSN